MKVASSSPLGKSALDAAIAQMRVKLRKPFDESFVEFSLDATAGVLHVVSLERSATGQYGKYAGQASLSYEKISLNAALPSPILYAGEYPALFIKFAGWLYQQYGLLLEENEFEIVGAPGALINSSFMTFKPAANTGVLELRALPQSGRFVAGSTLRLLMAPSNGVTWLPGLVPSAIQGDLQALSYGT